MSEPNATYHQPHDIGLGNGIARVLVSVGVVGVLCLIVGFVLTRYSSFVEGDSQARRGEILALVSEMKATRERDFALRERSLLAMLAAVTAVERQQEAVDSAVRAIRELTRELIDNKKGKW